MRRSQPFNNCIIVVPVYKKELLPFERMSLMQCIDILGNYPICIVAPENLDMKAYLRYSSNLEVEFFNSTFFQGLSGYNRLLMSYSFYRRFQKYKYILIYQVDAFVFKDELKYWCTQEYDFIGAPWFFGHATSHLEGNIWRVGNGGFSLRNVKSSLKVLRSFKLIDSPIEILRQYSKLSPARFVIRLPKIIAKSFGYKNNSRYYINNIVFNEDVFWCFHAQRFYKKYKIAPLNIALKFSFECDPNYLYKLNNYQLPFGCHGWNRYDLAFWKPFIKKHCKHSFVI